MVLVALFPLSVSFSYGDFTVTNATCIKSSSDYVLRNYVDETGIAWGVYNWSIWASGWYELHIHGNPAYNDSDIAYCAGLIEGFLTHQGIYDHAQLILAIKGYDSLNGSANFVYPDDVRDFMTANLNYVRGSIDAYLDDRWWVEIGIIMQQFKGLVDGYNRSAPANEAMTEFDHWFFQSAGDMFDIAEIFKDDRPAKEFRDHCTGLVRLPDDYSDIYFAHDAWSDFRELHGELKEYDLKLKAFTSDRLVMSTRVGKISSYDDFYLTSHGLYVLETTMNNYNDALYDVVRPQSVFTWLRAVHACWNATSGRDWGETFIRHNSGTYNNQYVIVDTNKFTRKSKPTTDLIWVVEQFPGLYNMSDVTSELVRDGYFPSVNMPWHENLYEAAGYPALVKSLGIYGAYRSNDKNPRIQIIHRDAQRIKSFDDFKLFMRYNQYWRDPYSQGDPAQQIASRYDQRPDVTAYGNVNSFGDMDTKALRYLEAATMMKFHAIASPPFDLLEIFPWDFNNYSNYLQEIPPYKPLNYTGLPSFWNFSWVEFGADGYNLCAMGDKNSCLTVEAWCGWCSIDEKCMIGDKDGPFFGKCRSGWVTKTHLPKWAVPVIAAVSSLVLVFVVAVFVLHFTSRKTA